MCQLTQNWHKGSTFVSDLFDRTLERRVSLARSKSERPPQGKARSWGGPGRPDRRAPRTGSKQSHRHALGTPLCRPWQRRPLARAGLPGAARCCRALRGMPSSRSCRGHPRRRRLTGRSKSRPDGDHRMADGNRVPDRRCRRPRLPDACAHRLAESVETSCKWMFDQPRREYVSKIARPALSSC